MSKTILLKDLGHHLKGKFIAWDKVDEAGRFFFSILGESKHEYIIISSYWEWRSFGERHSDAVDFSQMGFLTEQVNYDADMRTITGITYNDDNTLIIHMKGNLDLAIIEFKRFSPSFKLSKLPQWQIFKNGENVCESSK